MPADLAPATYLGGRWRRLWTGVSSAMSGPIAPLGRLWSSVVAPLESDERLSKGLLLILTGIEGYSALAINLAQGLNEGGVSCGIHIVDWTTGGPWLWRHLRDEDLHARGAADVTASIQRYQSDHPNQPVYLVGYSGGAGVALRALELLPADCRVDTVVLLCSAVSASYDLSVARSRVRGAMWNFWSPLDFGVLGLGTLVFGTFDGRHEIASGAQGFRTEQHGDLPQSTAARLCEFHQFKYRLPWLSHFHAGGHFGPMNRVFAAEVLAPLIVTAKPAVDKEAGAPSL